MKNKHFILALMLICASSLFAQDFYRGDTIRIIPSNKRYLTKEKMSNWVYDYNHVILKVGGVRFANGILVDGIYSWVKPEDIRMVAPCLRCREEDEAEAKRIADSIVAAQLTEMAEIEAAQAKAAQERHKALADSIAAYNDSIEAAEAAAAEALARRPVNRFTIGVRGGAASFMPQAKDLHLQGYNFDAALDLQYAHYWKTKKKHNVGLLVGASAAFARNTLAGPEIANYSVFTSEGTISYHIEDGLDLVLNEVQVEVPLMFSLVTKNGFFLNLGPKLMVPVYSFYQQNTSNANITATFLEEDVPVTNDPVTGVFPADKAMTSGQWSNALIHVMAAGELGGEVKLKNGDSFGIGVYGSYSFYNNYTPANSIPSSIQITPPTATSCAIVDVKCASDVYMQRIGYWDAGIKLAYHFNWPDRNDNKK